MSVGTCHSRTLSALSVAQHMHMHARTEQARQCLGERGMPVVDGINIKECVDRVEPYAINP